MAKQPLKDGSVLAEAIQSGSPIDQIKQMLTEGYALRATKGGLDPFLTAVSMYNAELVELLFAAGAKLNPSDRVLADAIMPDLKARPDEHTADPRAIAVMDVLARHGAEVDSSDKHTKQTALHTAALYGRSDYVRWLLAHGADPLAINSDGRSPRDVAEISLALQQHRVGGGRELHWARPMAGLELVIPMLEQAEAASGREKPPEPTLEDKYPIMKMPMPKRRGFCDLSLETAAQVLIRATLDELGTWFKAQGDTERIERDVMRRSDLPEPDGRMIGLVQFKGHPWIYVTGLPRSMRQMITKWSKALPHPILLAGADDTSGIAYAELYEGGKKAEKLQSTEKSWAKVDTFLKKQDAYLTFPYLELDDGKATLSGYHKDEALPGNVVRVDLIYMKIRAAK